MRASSYTLICPSNHQWDDEKARDGASGVWHVGPGGCSKSYDPVLFYDSRRGGGEGGGGMRDQNKVRSSLAVCLTLADPALLWFFLSRHSETV